MQLTLEPPGAESPSAFCLGCIVLIAKLLPVVLLVFGPLSERDFQL